jgi:hypothetical protein
MGPPSPCIGKRSNPGGSAADRGRPRVGIVNLVVVLVIVIVGRPAFIHPPSGSSAVDHLVAGRSCRIAARLIGHAVAGAVQGEIGVRIEMLDKVALVTVERENRHPDLAAVFNDWIVAPRVLIAFVFFHVRSSAKPRPIVPRTIGFGAALAYLRRLLRATFRCLALFVRRMKRLRLFFEQSAG